MELTFDFSDVTSNMQKFQSKFDAALSVFCDNGAQKMEQYAKEHRPWTDRTGSARQRLKGSWSKESDGYVIQIAHGVEYGVWLEFANERKCAILKPTIEQVGRKEIIPAFRNFVDKIKL